MVRIWRLWNNSSDFGGILVERGIEQSIIYQLYLNKSQN